MKCRSGNSNEPRCDTRGRSSVVLAGGSTSVPHLSVADNKWTGRRDTKP